MSVASIPNASIAGALDVAAPKSIEGGNSGDFLALLNIAGGKTESRDAEFRSDDDNQPPSDRNDDRERNRPDAPVAAAIDVPNVITDTVKPKSPEPIREVLDATEPHASDTTKHTSRVNTDNDNSGIAQAPSTDKVQDSNGAALPNEPSAPTASAVQAPSHITDTGPGQDLRDALGAQLGKIEQILATVIQALTGVVAGTQPTGTTPSTDDVSTATTGVTSPVVSSPADVSLLPPASLVPVAAGDIASSLAGSDNVPTADELALLKDIHSILRQMQKILAGNEGAVPHAFSPVAAEAFTHANAVALRPQGEAPDLALLADALQQKVAQLTELLSAQSPDAPGNSSSVPGWLKLVPVASSDATVDEQPVDIATLLKNGISEVRDQLQKLKNDNDSIFTQLKNDIQSQFEHARQLFKGDITSESLTIKDVAFQSALPAATSTITASAPQNIAPIVTNPVAGVATEIQVNNVQSNGGQFTNSDSGSNGQGQNPASLTAAAGMGQAHSGSNTGSASFARVLGQQLVEHPVAEQVAFHIKTALSDGSSRIRIQMDPADLGKLDIKLHVSADGKTGVVITADNRTTLDLLQRDMQGLARALTDAGLTTDSGSLSFNLRGEQQEQGQGGQQATGNYQKMQPDDEDDANLNIFTRSYTVNLAEGLDIKI